MSSGSNTPGSNTALQGEVQRSAGNVAPCGICKAVRLKGMVQLDSPEFPHQTVTYPALSGIVPPATRRQSARSYS